MRSPSIECFYGSQIFNGDLHNKIGAMCVYSQHNSERVLNLYNCLCASSLYNQSIQKKYEKLILFHSFLYRLATAPASVVSAT